MPGSSLWLLPPRSHPLHALLTTLIQFTLPARFPREAASSQRVAPHFFPAHVTLTSGIDPGVYGDDPQRWLDRIPFEGCCCSPAAAAAGGGGGDGGGGGSGNGNGKGEERPRARIRFERVVSQDVFYRRCFVRVAFEGVRELAGVARAVGVVGERVEVEEGGGVRFGGQTENWLREWREEFGPHVSLMYGDELISNETLAEITKEVQKAGVKLSEVGALGTEQNGLDGWDGGVIWLVPTDKPISQWWEPIATREI
ncbi:hypothetical protein VTI74DRAFT_4964 [Chaetomium olivicolor]